MIRSFLRSMSNSHAMALQSAELSSDDPLIDVQVSQGSELNEHTDVSLIDSEPSAAASTVTPTVSLDDPPLPESEQTSPSRSRRHRRSRQRYRRSRNYGWQNRLNFKKKESNFPAAVCSMIVVVLLCTALAEPRWFLLEHGSCHQKVLDTTESLLYLGLSPFYVGGFLRSAENSNELVYSYSSEPIILVNCVTPQAVQVLQFVIAACFLAVICSTMGFFLDLVGPTHKSLKIVQRNGMCNMLTVAVCVTITGFCYWLSQLFLQLQDRTKLHAGSKIGVQFSVSVFLVAAAGGMSVIAAACNLLKRHQPLMEGDQRHGLLDNFEGIRIPDGDPYGPLGFVRPPPPPPYAP